MSEIEKKIVNEWDFVAVGFCRSGKLSSGKMSCEILSEWEIVVVGKCRSGKLSGGK